MTLTIEAKKRAEGAKPRALRREGILPASLYGHDGSNSVDLTIDDKAMGMLLRQAKVNDTEIELNIPELSWTGPVVIREAQKHPWKGYLYHVSFFSVSDKK